MSQINNISKTDRRRLRRARRIGLLACLAVVPMLATSAIPAGAASTPAPGRQKCKPPKLAGQQSLDLTVFKISCAQGRSLSIKQYKCRKAHPKTNICPEKPRIARFKCREQRLYNRGYYDGRVACTRGRYAAVYIYRQKRPRLSGMSLRPRTIGPSTRARLSFRLSSRAGVTLTIARRHGGRRSASGRCSRFSRNNRGGRRCTYHVSLAGRRTVTARTGSNRIVLTRRFAGRTLRRGRYRLSVRPTGGTTRRLNFTVRSR